MKSQPKRNYPIPRKASDGLAVALFAILGLSALPSKALAEPKDRSDSNLAIYDQAWRTLFQGYFDPSYGGVDWKAAYQRHKDEAVHAGDDRSLYNAINALLGELNNSHAVAYRPQTAAAFIDAQGDIGVGFRLENVEGKPCVMRVDHGSPAELAGVRRGWIFLAVHPRTNGASNLTDLSDGESIQIDFLDEADRPKTLALNARKLPAFCVAKGGLLPNGVAYLRFDEFNDKAEQWLRDELKAFKAAPALILDLRENGGGTIDSLEEIAGIFFERSVKLGSVTGVQELVSTTGQGIVKRIDEDLNARSFLASHYEGKVAILIGPHTACASEILTGSFQRYKRGTVVGRKSAGKTESAKFLRLPDGGIVEFPYLDVADSSGVRLEKAPITPDIAVAPATLAEIRTGLDRDVQAALAILAGTKPSG